MTWTGIIIEHKIVNNRVYIDYEKILLNVKVQNFINLLNVKVQNVESLLNVKVQKFTRLKIGQIA